MSIDHVKRANSKPLSPRGDDPTSWIYLADLTLPPEVQQEVERECRELRLPRQAVEWRVEGAKLCHFFPDRAVAYKHTPRGPLVMMISEHRFTPEFDHFFQSLSPDERSVVIVSDTYDPNDGVLRMG